tara:strand:- start:78 stop:1940 length:1863 start_codon:yes stop_codon:yes gene_type:complete
MGFLLDAEATRSTLLSVDTTLSENINATQDYIPVTSTAGFSTSVVAEIESTNEVVSFASITENLTIYSQDFNHPTWSKFNVTVSADSTTAPDGTTTADTLTENTATSAHNISRNMTVNIGATVTASVFAKYNGRPIQLIHGGSDVVGGNVFANFNLQTGTIGLTSGSSPDAQATITDVGDGWFRCSITSVTAVTSGFNNNVSLISNANTSTRAESYTGDGSSGAFIWGYQLEYGSSPTGYLPTTTSSLQGLTTVTRGANGTTAASASSGDAIQQLPFSFQGVTANGSSTLSENIDASQDYIPVASTSGFATGVDATIESTNEVVSFSDISSNLFKYSEDFSNSYWTKYQSSITANAGVAPDGTTTADKFIPDTTASSVHVIDTTGFGVVPAGTHALSVYVKADGYDFFHWRTDGTNSFFDLTTGAVVSAGTGVTATIEDSGNGWYRCIVTKNFGGAARASFGITETGTSRNFTGDGTKGGLLWGAQAEQASAATTYLPTTSAALVGLTGVTRGANGTTAASALSGATISQAPSLTSIGMSLRLRALSVCSDGAGVGRLTLCNNNGDTLCDVDIPDDKVYTLEFGGGIVFPNGIFISNTDNITSYTLYTDKFSGNGLTAGA